jgi:hypothetical protein
MLQGFVAQLVEHSSYERMVAGSRPAKTTFSFLSETREELQLTQGHPQLPKLV